MRTLVGVVLGVVLVGVARTEVALKEEWLERGISHNSVKSTKENGNLSSKENGNFSSDTKNGILSYTENGVLFTHIENGESTEKEHVVVSRNLNIQDGLDQPEEGLSLREEEDGAEDYHKRKRKRSNDYGAPQYGEDPGLSKTTHVYSILALAVFSAFLGYMVYHYLSSAKKEERSAESQFWLWGEDNTIHDLLHYVTAGIERWALLEHLTEDDLLK
ncbi:uncharacterized protein [Procambarus clarkii]|uniref:uncharacterized protein n=1 Tax=Procambarus clarkii TaxID=6728 RepID=UPI001E67341D|nr:uncharacterized protein LOC123771811 [Procambarus clarkii]